MKLAILSILLAGCAITPDAQRAVAERRVNLTAWGIYCLEMTVCGIGYLQYQRNPQKWDQLKPAEIVVP